MTIENPPRKKLEDLSEEEKQEYYRSIESTKDTDIKFENLSDEEQQEHLRSLADIEREKKVKEIFNKEKQEEHLYSLSTVAEIQLPGENEEDKLIDEKRHEILKINTKDSTLASMNEYPEKGNIWQKEPQQKKTWLGKLWEKAKNPMKKSVLTGAFVAGSLAGQAKEKEPIDSTGNGVRTENPINFNSARKVKEKPDDYNLIHTENNKQFFGKKIPGKSEEIGMAKPGDAKGGKEYENWIITKLKSGSASPQELVEKGYISPDKKSVYEKYYAPSIDIVYTETEQGKESDPFSAFATKGTPIYAPGANGHITAELFYPVLSSTSEKDGGMLNTSQQKVLVRFRNDFGFTGESIVLNPEELGDIFGGTNHFHSKEKLDEIHQRASLAKGNDTYELTAKDIAKGSTLEKK